MTIALDSSALGLRRMHYKLRLTFIELILIRIKFPMADLVIRAIVYLSQGKLFSQPGIFLVSYLLMIEVIVFS